MAIKRLQAQGLSLAAVQERVVGRSNKALRRLAAVDVAVAGDGPAAKGKVDVDVDLSARPAASRSRSESFWRVQPEPEEEQAAATSAAESPAREAWSLEAGLVLTLTAGRKLNDDDLRVIRMAAAPLIEILRLRGLIGARRKGRGEE